MSEKLQKVLARSGLGSRRTMEQYIREGRIRVNGRPATLGDRVEPDARIQVDGKPLASRRLQPPRRRVLIYHKPVGELTTRSDPQGRPTVFQRLPGLEQGRWVAVGRLDINTCGLLLLTTDGELANRLMHPRYQLPREYAVRVYGEVPEATLQRLRDGVELEDGPARFDAVERLSSTEGSSDWYRVVLHEGRKREVRRLWESQGVRVSRLLRTRYGPVGLPRGMHQGELRELQGTELQALLASVGLGRPRAAPAGDAARRPAGAGRRRPARTRKG